MREITIPVFRAVFVCDQVISQTARYSSSGRYLQKCKEQCQAYVTATTSSTQVEIELGWQHSLITRYKQSCIILMCKVSYIVDVQYGVPKPVGLSL